MDRSLEPPPRNLRHNLSAYEKVPTVVRIPRTQGLSNDFESMTSPLLLLLFVSFRSARGATAYRLPRATEPPNCQAPVDAGHVAPATLALERYQRVIRRHRTP